MAIVNMPQDARVQLKVQTGLSASGAPVYATRSFNNVKASAPDANLYAVALQLGGLQSHTLTAISKVETSSLIEQ